MHEVDEPLYVLDRGLRQNAVAEVEDMPGSARGALQHAIGGARENLPGCKKKRGIQVALHRDAAAHAVPRLVQGSAPVHPDDGSACLALQLQELAGVGSEVDDGNPELADVGEDG